MNRKIISTLLIFMMLFSIVSPAFAAEDDNTLVVSVTDAVVDLDQGVTSVQVDVVFDENPGVYAVNFALEYDETVMTYASATDEHGSFEVVSNPESNHILMHRPYSNKDEFLYGKYTGFPRGGAGLQALAENCTNPNVPFEATTFGDGETQYQSATHGADTDGDAVPDGWEIYVGYDPLNALDAVSDDDDDLVSLAAEYMSNDGASVYGECETVTANTTADRGWYNKFFPTDPRDADTDGDGVSDANEGRKWVSGWVFDRWGQNGSKRITHYTIYG